MRQNVNIVYRTLGALTLGALLISCVTPVASKSQAEAHYNLGLSYMTGEKLQAAYVELQKAIIVNPGYKDAFNALGVVQLKLREYENAEGSFRKALEIDRDFSDAYNNLCFLFMQQALYEKALDNCNKALENPLYASPEKTYFYIGGIHYATGSYSMAANAFERAILRSPRMVPAYYSLALSYNANGEYGKASSALTRAIERDPMFRGNMELAKERFVTTKATTDDPEQIKRINDLLEIMNY